MQANPTMTPPNKIAQGALVSLKHLLLMFGAAIMILPFIWMLSTSLKNPPEVLAYPPRFIPLEPTLANFTNVFTTAPFVRFFFNSLLVSTVSTISVIFTSVLAGFIFAKYKFPGQWLLFILILATAMVPFETFMIPLYLLMKSLRLIDTYPALIGPYMIMSYGIFFMRQNIKSSVPDELIDAARIDGCSEWRIFGQIILPLMKSAVGALGIFAFMQSWAAFIWPLLITSTRSLWTMELGLGMFQFQYSIDEGAITAGSVISLIPILTVFFLLRRNIIQGITITGMKG